MLYAVLVLAYPLLQVAFVPQAYRQRYTDYPVTFLRILTAGLYWGTILFPLIFGQSPAFIGVAVHLCGASLTVAAMRVNPFFVPDAVWLSGQYIVRQGVYRFLKHPGYTGMVLMVVGNTASLGGSAAMPALAYLFVLFWHVRKENEVLRNYAI